VHSKFEFTTALHLKFDLTTELYASICNVLKTVYEIQSLNGMHEECIKSSHSSTRMLEKTEISRGSI
jgi:hypothetical protein